MYNIEEALNRLGISVRQDDGEYRLFEDVLKDISQLWDKEGKDGKEELD